MLLIQLDKLAYMCVIQKPLIRPIKCEVCSVISLTCLRMHITYKMIIVFVHNRAGRLSSLARYYNYSRITYTY